MIPPTPALIHFCDLEVALGPAREMGPGRAGQRRIIPIIGGTVTGPGISGRILNLGADWQTIHTGDLAHLDTRYAFETDDGALIEVINTGFRHGPPEVLERLAKGEDVPPTDYTMRTTARLETGHPDYAHLNRKIFVGAGARLPTSVHMRLYDVT